MKSSSKFLLTTLSILICPTALAQTLTEQCLLGVPKFEGELVEGSINDLPVSIDADELIGFYPSDALFVGNVILNQGNSTLKTDRLRLTQNEDLTNRTATATGNVFYKDNIVQLTGDTAHTDLLNRDTDVTKGFYDMVGRQGRGEAEKLEIRDNSRFTILKNGTFTSCLQGDNSWSVSGTTVIHDKEDEVAKVFNAIVRLGPVPILYSPYLEFPLGDRRRSGFLLPSFRYSSSNDFEFTIPYYWNIAPNYDATISPHYISARGLQLQNEFRYLNQSGSGLMQGDYLKDDKLADRDRWLFYWQHSGVINKVWRLNADFTRVSDIRYFTDLETLYGNSTSGYATQNLSAGYADQSFDISLSSTRFQIFADSTPSAYRSEPKLDFNYYKPDLGYLDLKTFGQFVQFKNDNPRNPNITRWHIEPTLNLPLSNQYASLDTEVKLLGTYYQQDRDNRFTQSSDYKKHYSRVLAQYRADARMVFERRFGYEDSFTQTLEPRVQYLYTPFKDQTNIINLDSALLQNDTIGLFRDRIYSGIDRIASSNLLATGVTSRVYDKNAEERFNFSIGQIYHFSPQKTEDGQFSSKIDENAERGSLTWAADSMFKIDEFWGLRGGLQYDTRLSSLAVANSIIEYRKDKDRLIQASYRYANSDYITATLDGRNNPSNPRYLDGISQTGLIASWPVFEKVALVGRVYYDTNSNKPAEQFAGLQYNSCCWGLGVSYERKIIGFMNDESRYDEKISLIFQINGLGREIDLGSQNMLKQGILPYRRSF
ncbi:LPS assembly protein LptD [Thorsellia anophelis]|uniref:LPS-assembly protein LptD n=1 Tax=Thorsellia anophelis DSM 18579 TaxID=1123402 RepID=A0A1I0AAE7_9GAMM|nr:LPS assembly protein LptD [Thorsellia anophelis]SES91146.1 LPS-assembly protein [Thorsellia anophelis DSM 18579]